MPSDRGPKSKLTDINRFLSELNESFSIITDLEQLKDNFSARLKDIFNTNDIRIFLLNPDLNRFQPVERIISATQTDHIPQFYISDKLIFWLSVNKTFLVMDDNKKILEFLTPREQELLARLNVGLVYPFIVMNQVKGLVCIGRIAEKNYNMDELMHFKVLLDQAGFAFENAYHYHLQKERTRRMYRADRLATLGELAAGAAHEIRNPLTSIRSSIQFLKRRLKLKGDLEIADDLISEVDRINEIIEGMLSFAKPQEPKKEAINLRILLNQSVQLVSNLALKKGIALSMKYHAHNEQIIADQTQLKQVFLNVLMNALQSIDTEAGSVIIDVNEASGVQKSTMETQTFIIEITDSGKGIDPESIDKIFDPFFTTKSEGTGLGLSISYGIVGRHGGEIELASEPGKGTKVKIKLPMK
jgi:signal transduction histidine kinase